MSGKGYVSEHLKKRVLEAAEALDYHPDQVARSLKVRRTRIIGVVIPELTNPFFGEIMRAVEDQARKCGYSTIFCDSNENPELEREHLDTLFARRVDGVLLSSSFPLRAQSPLSRRRFPLVFFDRTPPGFSGTAVVSDNLGGSREATRHLTNLGHTRIAIITGPLDMPICAERLEGFRQALQEAVLPLPEEYVKRGNFESESGYRHGCELMGLPNPPTAIFCCNNLMTLGLMRALAERDIPCPERVSVLGFDDFEWVAGFRPQLTAVAQPTREMGKRATQMLIQEIEQEKGEAGNAKGQLIVLPNELRIRESTAPPYCPAPPHASP
jgi:LacI family transcriptional regulator